MPTFQTLRERDTKEYEKKNWKLREAQIAEEVYISPLCIFKL